MEYIELEVWKESRVLVNILYKITGKFPQEEMYSLTNQMRRSAISIPSNIAEGCGRRTSTDSLQFLHIARGSLYELETQIYLALDQEYLNKESFENLQEQIVICKKLLNGFINYYKNNTR